MTETRTDTRTERRTTQAPAMTARLYPHDETVEEALLGALITSPGDLALVAGLVEPDDFFIVRHGWIFRAMLAIWQAGDRLDYVTLTAYLREQGQLEEIGGAAYLTQLSYQTGIDFDAEAYAQIVQRFADKRRLVTVAESLANLALDDHTPVATAYATFMQQAIQARPRSANHRLVFGTGIEERFLALQGRPDGAVRVFPLPFGAEDEPLPFFTSGHLFGIGGDEKTGKSALAETLAEHWASLGKRGFYIHTEEKTDDKILRRYARWSGVEFLKLETGRLSDDDLERRGRALTYCRPWADRIDLYHEPAPTAESVTTLIRRACEVFGAEFVVVDNVTDIRYPALTRNQSEARAAMWLLQDLEALAVEFKVLIVLVTQMTTQLTGKRIAYGSSGFNKKLTWFWDINRKVLEDALTYEADGITTTLPAGVFDPRVDIYQAATRYGSGSKIPVFADLRRHLWRPRHQARIVIEPIEAEPPDLEFWHR